MGHSDAIRTIKGVKDARQYTHAIKGAINRVRNGENPDLTKRQEHRRECLVVFEDGLDQEERLRISQEIVEMDNYFKPYDTSVCGVTQEELDRSHSAMPHDGLVLAVGETGDGNYASIEYKNVWQSNPEATGNILVPCARACHEMNKTKRFGAYTMLDLSPADLSIHSQEELLSNFV